MTHINKLIILLTSITLLICVIPSASAGWVPNSSIITGLGDIGSRSGATIYDDNGTWKLISGRTSGAFVGFEWNGTSWVSNSSIITGLGDVGGLSIPTVYNDSGTWKLIAGENLGNFNGFEWNGTSWVLNSSIITGLGDIGGNAAPIVYNDSGTWKLIAGEIVGNFNGFEWNGTSWVPNSSIITGLGDVGAESRPTVYDDNGTWKLISGISPGTFVGFEWNGTSWVSNSSIITGLGDVGTYSSPMVYSDSGLLKLITGESTGVFYGYNWNNLSITSLLKTEGQTNPTQIVTNTSTPYFNWTYSDADNDTQYSWEIQVGTASGLSDMWAPGQLLGTDINDIYAGSTLSRNTTYYVQVRTNDSYENSTWATGTFKINALPIISNITISPIPAIDTDDLTANNDTATDGDGDSITLYHRWYKDDVLQPALNDIVTILAANTTDGEVWKVGIIPNDSYENGTETFSGTVTIGSGNYAPTLTSITTNVSTKKYGYDILVSTVDAYDQNDDNYILHIGSTTGASDLCNSTSTPNGTEAPCTITVNWITGSHTLYGRLTDANDTSIEKTVVITVDTTPPVVGTNSVSPASITTDDNNTITAAVTVANGSVDWVKVKVRDPNVISTNYTMTGANGTYTYTFTPGAAGDYLITNFYAADDSGNIIDESVSVAFEVVTGSSGSSPGGGGGAPDNITVVGDLTLTPDRKDTYFFYTTVTGEQSGVYTFVANRNVEFCIVDPNSDATCKIVGGNTIEVTLVVDETVKTYDGTVTVTDENDYVASSTLVVRIIKIWGSIPIGKINVGPLADILSIIFETDGDFLIGIRSWFAGSVVLLFGFTMYKSYRQS